MAFIERVEYIIGPYSALYGRNSFTGVLNIITKEGKDIRGFIADMTYEVPYNHHKIEIVAGNKIGKFDFYMSLYANGSNTGRDLAKEYPEKYSYEARQQALIDNGEGKTMHPDAPRDFYIPWHNEFVYLRLKHETGLFAELNYIESRMPKVSERFNPLLYYQNRETQMDMKTSNVSLGYEFKNKSIESRTVLNGQHYDYAGPNGYVQSNKKKWYADRFLGVKVEQQLRYKLLKSCLKIDRKQQKRLIQRCYGDVFFVNYRS